jgi:alpha-L-rhamnosidase
MDVARATPRAPIWAAALLLAACGRPEETARAPDPTLAATDLRCEHRSEPLGLDTRAPRFAWTLVALDPERRGLAQSAYRILVAATEAELEAERGTLWDSGRVASRATLEVEYAGRALESFQQALWQVQVFDQDGTPSAWSAPARFGTGALEPEAWRAEWIGFDAPLASAPVVPDLGDARWVGTGDGARELWLRRRFELEDDADPQAVAVVAAADEFELFLNGKSVLRGASNSGVRRNAELVRIAPHLARGTNLVAVRVRASGEHPAAFTCRLLFAAGGPELVSDGSWRAQASAAQGLAADLDDSGWGAAVVADESEPWLPDVDPPAAFLPPPRLLRTEFRTPAAPVRATLFASALGVYSLELNGQRASEDWLAPGWTDYGQRIPYRAYDVTSLVRAGDNALGVVLADGWYAGLLGKRGQRNHYGKAARFLGQLVLDYPDGTRELVASDAGWRAALGPWREADLYMGERYDARIEPAGWSAPGFDAGRWRAVDVDTRPTTPLVAHPGPPIRVVAELAPVSVVARDAGRVLHDFGQNVAGVARLAVEAPAGTALVLRFAEALDADGALMRRNLTWARASEQYFCKGGGRETWQPRFTYHGFRYVEVAGVPEGVKLELTALALSSATRDAGWLRASDPEIERLVEAARWTMRANSMDLPTDSPQRGERLGWTGDGQLFAPSALWLADLATLYDKWSIDLLDAQRPDGRFPNTAPSFPGMDLGGPAWEDAGVLVPALLLERTGDRRLAERHHDSMARFVEACLGRLGPDGAPPAEIEGYGDWRNWQADTPREVLWLAYLARSTRRLAEVARALGRTAETQRLEARLTALRASAGELLVDAEGRVRGETQTGWALALAEGLVPEERRARAGERLAAEVEGRGHATTGFVGTPELLPALSAAGRSDLAYRLLARRELPSWGHMLAHGPGTIWERWDAWTEAGGYVDGGRASLSHTPLASYVAWLFEHAAGIRPGAPGFESVLLAPEPGGGLAWIEARHDSVRGRIELRWELAGDALAGDAALTVDVRVPPNVTATLTLRDPGTVLEGGQPLAAVRGVRELARVGSSVLLELDSGHFRFTCRAPR